MKKLFKIIGIIVLCGILAKLSYVFWYLFAELDNGSAMSKITGITFAFASVYFVVEIQNNLLKITMVALDISTILYYYLNSLWHFPIEYAAVIVAAYSGLIVFFLGRIVSDKMKNDTDTETDRLRNELNRLRAVSEINKLETERKRLQRCISESKNKETKNRHEAKLAEIEKKLKTLNNNIL